MIRFEAPHQLHGCQLKLDRAYEHTDTLNHAVEGFLRRHPHEVVVELKTETREYIGWMKVRETPPRRWSIIAGDAIHNMRSALDHLVYQLALANGKSTSGLSYPVLTEDPCSPEASKRSRDIWGTLTERIHPDDLAIIERTQPYNRPDSSDRDPLLMLSRLSNWDKHRQLHLAASVMTRSEFGFEAVRDVELGDADFGHYGPFKHGTIVAVCPCRFTGTNPQVDVNGQLSYGVAFAEGGPDGVEGREIIQVLTRLTNFVHDILLDLGSSPRFNQNDSTPLQQ